MLGDVLLLYMAVMPEAGSSVLMREEGDEQQPIYYVSNTFKNAELWYSRIEKVGFTGGACKTCRVFLSEGKASLPIDPAPKRPDENLLLVWLC